MANAAERKEKLKFANITNDGKLTKVQVEASDSAPPGQHFDAIDTEGRVYLPLDQVGDFAEKMKADDGSPGKVERTIPHGRTGRGQRLAANPGLDDIDGGRSGIGSTVVRSVLYDIDRRLDALEADADRLLRRQDAAA